MTCSADSYPSGYAWGKCPLGCGAVGGDLAGMWDVKPPPPDAEHVRDLPHGFVRLWDHAYRRRPALSPCVGSRSLTVPLPLAAPTGLERQEHIAELANAVAESEPLTLFTPD